jgi:hypothetical protein
MSITFENANYEFKKVSFNVDEILADHIKDPFPKMSGFFWLIVGKSGSGKTSLLINALCSKGKNRVYRKVFDKISLVMPSNSRKSLNECQFDDLPEDQKFEQLDSNVLEKVLAIKKEFEKEKEDRLKEGKPKKRRNQLLILDDVTAQLKDKQNYHDLVELATNRRHYNLSIILLVQYLRSVPLPVRFQTTHITCFKIANEKDGEIIQEEYINLKKDEFNDLKRAVWKDKHDFLMIDKDTDTYYRNLQKINFHSNDINDAFKETK